ncbi:MAG: hypothetical protein K0R24_870 [Gammaproteobacteria bacterium]|jgi:hypothetical protein|nr:hypothetical protein [Gammaproteobacteria bacterium]
MSSECGGGGCGGGGNCSSYSYSESWKEREARERKRAILTAAENTVKKADDLANRLPESALKQFIKNLGDYLSARSNEKNCLGQYDYTEIDRRSNFIDECLNIIRSNNRSAQRFEMWEKHIQESNIKNFKGFSSKRLYTLLQDGQLFLAADLDIASEAANRLSAHPSSLLNRRRDSKEENDSPKEALLRKGHMRSQSS